MKKNIYYIINAFVLILTTILFGIYYFPALSKLINMGIRYLLVLSCNIILINFIKAFRFYFVLSGNISSIWEYIKQYCKTIPVNVVVPFKLGEVFRVYCYGYQMKNYFAGIIYVLIDRFFDTLALISVILAASLVTQIQFNWLVYLLFLFMFFVAAAYILMPRICMYWKKYLLHEQATKRGNECLAFIVSLEKICDTISQALRGRGVIVYALSILAWLIEICGVLLLNKIDGGSVQVANIINYLSSALGIGNSDNLQYFVLGTVVMLLCTYIVLHFRKKIEEY